MGLQAGVLAWNLPEALNGARFWSKEPRSERNQIQELEEMRTTWVNRTLLAATLLTSGPLWSAGADTFQVQVEISTTKYVEPVKALCEEWYPKINSLLNADYPGRMPDDYHTMIIHELAHVVQNYKRLPDTGWLGEGIAGYVRHKYYEKDIEPKLHLDKKGNLQGLGRGRTKPKLDQKGYLIGYTVASAFLFWLEVRKDQQIVPTLNLALREKRYSDDIFKQRCGAPLDALWHEFMVQSTA